MRTGPWKPVFVLRRSGSVSSACRWNIAKRVSASRHVGDKMCMFDVGTVGSVSEPFRPLGPSVYLDTTFYLLELSEIPAAGIAVDIIIIDNIHRRFDACLPRNVPPVRAAHWAFKRAARDEKAWAQRSFRLAGASPHEGKA